MGYFVTRQGNYRTKNPKLIEALVGNLYAGVKKRWLSFFPKTTIVVAIAIFGPILGCAFSKQAGQ